MNSDTMLLRQIHPSFVQQGRVTSQAFRPTPKDQHKLSVYDGDQIDAAGSFRHYTDHLKLASVGVLGITVAECTELELSVKPDPEPFPEHAVIDFLPFDKKTAEKKAKLLKTKAVARDWLYRID